MDELFAHQTRVAFQTGRFGFRFSLFELTSLALTNNLSTKMPDKYFVCLDFEATCWPGDSRKGIAEIIGKLKWMEFPMLKVFLSLSLSIAI